MSGQGHHSKDPGKASHDKSESKDDKQHGSPSKWNKKPTTSSPISDSPTTHAGPSSKSQTPGMSIKDGFGKISKKFQNFHSPAGVKDDHKSSIPVAVPMIPVKTTTPTPPEVDAMLRLKLDGAAPVDFLIGNGVPPIIPNGIYNSNEAAANSDNSENYSDDHESGSSMGGGQDSGRNSNQSPSDSCALQTTHISALPENVLENIFSFMELGDIRNATLICQEWSRVIGDENNEVWRTQCFKRMSRDVVYSELLTACPSFRAKLRAHIHGWNPLDCSRNIYVKPNGFTIHRNPVAQSTDGARGRIGFNRGRRWLTGKSFGKDLSEQ